MSLPEKVKLNDADRELWLSKHLDGELTPEQTRAVVEKLRTDAAWRAEFEELKQADATAGHVIARYHHDSPMAREIVRRIEATPGKVARRVSNRHAREAVRRRLHRHGSWFVRLAGVAALVAIGVYGWKNYDYVASFFTQPATQTTPVAVKAAPTVAPEPELSKELAFVALPDGTQVWMRKGSHLESTGSRAVKFDGQAYFHIAAAEESFTITTPDGTKTYALGTRFDVTTQKVGTCVRVAEGHVSVYSYKERRDVDAFGGTEVRPDLSTRPIDPRTVALEWSRFVAAKSAPAIADGLISPWAQSGGSPGHSGITPLPGPAVIVDHKDAFFAIPNAATMTVGSSAVVSGGIAPSAYLLAHSVVDKDHPDAPTHSTLLRMELTGSQRGQWKVCADFTGHSYCAPIVTPSGLVIYVDADGKAVAYNPNDDKAGFTMSYGGKTTALAIGNNDALIRCTNQGILTHKKDGSILACTDGIKSVQAPVCVLPNGHFVAVAEPGVVAMLDGFKAVWTKTWGEHLMQAPVASESGDAVYVLSSDGRVGKFSTADGSITEKRFGRTPVFGMLGNGLLGFNGVVADFAKPIPEGPGRTDTITALVQGGGGELFIAFKNGLLHQRNGAASELIHITQGEVLPGGVSLAPGMIVVTTTQGVQLFE